LIYALLFDEPRMSMFSNNEQTQPSHRL